MPIEKPMRLFASPFSGRVYAVRAYKEVKPGVFEVTGKKFDVTEDFKTIAKSMSEAESAKGESNGG